MSSAKMAAILSRGRWVNIIPSPRSSRDTMLIFSLITTVIELLQIWFILLEFDWAERINENSPWDVQYIWSETCFHWHIEAETNGRHFPDNIFKWIFLNEHGLIWLGFHRSLFLRVQITIFQHWSDNGLAPSRWQAIIWMVPSHYLNQWWLYASFGINELTVGKGSFYWF